VRFFGPGIERMNGELPVSSAAAAYKLSLLVPGRNEERHIGELLDDLAHQPFIERLGEELEVIVIDDGSSDRMAEVARAKAPLFRRLRVLSLPTNLGKGLALQRGVSEAQGEVIGFIDGDFTFAHSSIERFYEEIRGGADLAVGNRRDPGTIFQLPPGTIPYIHLRHFVGERFNDLVRAATPIPLLDTQCGFKFFRREAARVAFSRLHVGGFVFDLELLLTAYAAGFRVVPLPVVLKYVTAEPLSEVASLSGSVSLAFMKVLRNLRAGRYVP
jgi:dolichyl-phosphate beta-glucosyltransferase